MRVPVRRSILVFLLAVIVTACGSTPPSTPVGSGAASGPVATAQSAGSGGPQKGPLDASLVSSWHAPTSLDAQALGNQAEALGAQLRKDVDAASVYGAVVADQETALGGMETQALTALRDQLQAKLNGGTAVPDATLAAFRIPLVADPVRRDQGLLGMTWFYVLFLGLMSISSFDPRHGDSAEMTISLPMNSTTGNSSQSGQVTLTMSITGGVVAAKLELLGSVTTTAASSGRQVTTAGASSFAFTINPCPDAGGGVSGTVDVQDSETTTSPDRMTLGWKITGHSDFRTQVTDQAEIGTTATKVKWDQQLTRTIDQSHTSDIAITTADAYNADGSADASQSSATVDNVDGTFTMTQVKEAAQLSTVFGETTPLLFVKTASDVWKGGKCFEVRPDPKEAEVDPGSQTQVKVTVYHWVDQADVQLPVTATLSGSKTIDPSGTPVTSPATFTYTAAGPGTQGQVTFKVVSKRGIGSADGTYKVKGNLTIDVAGTYVENAGGLWLLNLKVAGSGIKLTANPDGSISASGTVTVKGTAKATVAPCSGTINEQIPVMARGQLQGTPDNLVWHVQLGPASLNNLNQTIQCPMISATTLKGDYFGQWSTTLGFFDLPAAGGAVTLSGSTSGMAARQATGTITAQAR